MGGGKFIRVGPPTVLRGRLVQSRLSYSGNIAKYFSDDVFFAEYGRDVGGVSPSILTIPALANVIAVAWVLGADIYVDELDKTYLESLEKVRRVMGGWYPKLPFSTEVVVRKAVSNRFSNDGYGLLFSGGVDSTASYIRNRHRKPNLIMVWGVDVPLKEREQWMRIRGRYAAFAEAEGIGIDFVRSNLREFLNELLLNGKIGRFATAYDWWGCFQHGMSLLGICAPLSAVSGIGTVLIASSYSGLRYPFGSDPLTDNRVAWADVKVNHDGFEHNRQEKIGIVLKGYIEEEGRYPHLRVCFSQYSDFNCGKCRKCAGTMAELVFENIDPARCGFPRLDANFLTTIRDNAVKNGIGPYVRHIWLNRQRRIPKEIAFDLYGSRAYMEWLRDFDIAGNTRDHPWRRVRQLVLSGAYGAMPKAIREPVLAAHRDAIALGRKTYDLRYTFRYVLRARTIRKLTPARAKGPGT